MTTDDDQAAAFRARLKAREAYRTSANAALKGNATRGQAVATAWEPVTKWLAERKRDRGR